MSKIKLAIILSLLIIIIVSTITYLQFNYLKSQDLKKQITSSFLDLNPRLNAYDPTYLKKIVEESKYEVVTSVNDPLNPIFAVISDIGYPYISFTVFSYKLIAFQKYEEIGFRTVTANTISYQELKSILTKQNILKNNPLPCPENGVSDHCLYIQPELSKEQITENRKLYEEKNKTQEQKNQDTLNGINNFFATSSKDKIRAYCDDNIKIYDTMLSTGKFQNVELIPVQVKGVQDYRIFLAGKCLDSLQVKY
jgi:hypothetical protein